VCVCVCVCVCVDTKRNIMTAVMGKAEGKGENWHGHVTAVTVGPEFRRIGMATTLMKWLEDVSEQVYA
jgi:N-terminal acetyltransferase B complex catalytic subunit